MNRHRALTTALLAPLVMLLMEASPAQAAIIVADMFVTPGGSADFVYLDLSDDFQMVTQTDTDLDGVIQFNLDPVAVLKGSMHTQSCVTICNIGSDGFTSAVEGFVFPMFVTNLGEPLLVIQTSPPTAGFPTFSLGQSVLVADGEISGVPELSLRLEQGLSAEDLLRIDPTTLPTYSGTAEVAAMVVYDFPDPLPAAGAWAMWLLPLSLIAFGLWHTRRTVANEIAA